MLEPHKLSAASTALVCLATIALVPAQQSWAVPVTMNDGGNRNPTNSNSAQQTIAQQTQRPNFQWSSFGLFPNSAGNANAQLNPIQVATNPIQVAALTSERIRRQTANKKKKQPSKNKNFKALVAECLVAQNKMRRLHKVPELEWDDKLAAFAQKRSDHIAASDGKEFGHPPDLPFGENLFWHSSLDTSCEYMVKGWYDEIDLYDFKAPTFAPATGHFTQMIWRGTQKVGCAFAPSTGPRGGLYLTCNYDPPGNWVGEFEENVPLPVVEKGPSAPRELAPPRTPSTTTKPVIITSTTTTTTTSTTTVRPTSVVTVPSAAVGPTVPSATDKQPAETTKPKSKKKKKKKKKSSDKKDEKEKKKGNKKKKKKGGKKKKKTGSDSNTSTKPPTANTTTKAPGLISS